MYNDNNMTTISNNKIWLKWRSPITALFLGVLSFISYQSAITYDFLNYDDKRVLTDHPELYNQPTVSATLKAIILENYPREEPLLIRDLSWSLDSRIFGFKNPRGAHLGNILLHSLATSLFFIFILVATRTYLTALIASIIAVTLAVHVEPVVWVMGRKDVLVACFGLLVMIATIRMIDTSKKGAKIFYYLTTVLFIVLAFFSKISAIVFPLALMVLAGLRPYLCGKLLHNDTLPWRHIIRSILLFIPHLIISFMVYKWYHGILSAYGIMDRGYDATGVEHLRNLLVIDPLVFWRYMSNLFIPTNLSLFYNWPSISSDFAWYHIALSVVTILVTIGLFIFMLIKRKDLLCYFLIFTVLMIPYLNLVYFGIWVANRYIYFSSLFLVAAIATILTQLISSHSKYVRGMVVLLLIILCTFNVLNKSKYIQVWENDEILWTYEIGLSDPRPEAFENLANHYYTAGLQAADIESRNYYFAKVDVLIEKARYRLGNSPKERPLPLLYRILFLDALMSIARHDPWEKQLATLTTVENLNPGFDAVLWQLTVLYYKQAIKTKNIESQKELVDTSLMWYKRYINVVKKDSNSRHKDKAVRAEYLRDFPFAKEKLNELDG